MQHLNIWMVHDNYDTVRSDVEYIPVPVLLRGSSYEYSYAA